MARLSVVPIAEGVAKVNDKLPAAGKEKSAFEVSDGE